MQFTVTDAGRAALVNAQNTGTANVLIASIGVSDVHAPGDLKTLTALPGELKRLSTFGGAVTAPDTIHVTIRDESADAYSLRAFAVYLGDGTLFGAFSQAAPIMEKSAASMMLEAVDITFKTLTTANIEFGGTGFINPEATETSIGVVELANDSEMDAGADPKRVITVRAFARRIANILTGYSQTNHKHDAADVTTGTFALGRIPAITLSMVTGLATVLAGKADAGHKHAASDVDSGVFDVGRIPALAMEKITGLATALAAKAALAGAAFTGAISVAGEVLGVSVRLQATGTGNVGSGAVLRSRYAGDDDYGLSICRQKVGVATEIAYFDHTGALYAAGSKAWTAATFDPALKANLLSPEFIGEVHAKGPSAIFTVAHRDNASKRSGLYAAAGDARIWDSERGDLIQFSENDVFVRVSGALHRTLHLGNLDLWWPAGEPKLFIGQSIPPGARLLIANGAAVSRTTYARLFAVIGTFYGAGDGATTFNVPDLRGVFYRAADLGRGIDAGRTIGSYQESQNKSHTHGIPEGSSTSSVSGGFTGYVSGDDYTSLVAGYSTSQSEGGTEARPRNVAFLPCITY